MLRSQHGPTDGEAPSGLGSRVWRLGGVAVSELAGGGGLWERATPGSRQAVDCCCGTVITRETVLVSEVLEGRPVGLTEYRNLNWRCTGDTVLDTPHRPDG